MSNFLGRPIHRTDDDRPPSDYVLRRPNYVRSHRGSFLDFEARLRTHVTALLRGGWSDRSQLTPHLLSYVSDERNLAAAWCHVRDRGGRAAGSDGDTFDNYDPFDIPWELLKAWRDEILAGEFVPDPDRLCVVPKGGNRGTRTITVLTIRDHVVNRAAVQVLQTVFDRFFDPFSFGCRPSPTAAGVLRRGTLPAVATAMTLDALGYVHWVAEDLRDAFGRVPLPGVMEVVAKYLAIPDPMGHPLTRFIHSLVSGAARPGLRQGSPLSPFLLNLYLDHHLDRVWRRHHPGRPLIRYVDDLLVLCRTRSDALAAHAALAALLRPKGMLTKLGRVKAVRALDGRRPVAWLGYNFHRTRAGTLHMRPGARGWESLEVALTEPGLTAEDAEDRVACWLDAFAPAYGHCNRRLVCARLEALVAPFGFSTFPDSALVLAYWQKCYARWHRTRNDTVSALSAQRLLPGQPAAVG